MQIRYTLITILSGWFWFMNTWLQLIENFCGQIQYTLKGSWVSRVPTTTPKVTSTVNSSLSTPVSKTKNTSSSTVRSTTTSTTSNRWCGPKYSRGTTFFSGSWWVTFVTFDVDSVMIEMILLSELYRRRSQPQCGTSSFVSFVGKLFGWMFR